MLFNKAIEKVWHEFLKFEKIKIDKKLYKEIYGEYRFRKRKNQPIHLRGFIDFIRDTIFRKTNGRVEFWIEELRYYYFYSEFLEEIKNGEDYYDYD